jgi:hypothetical protein
MLTGLAVAALLIAGVAGQAQPKIDDGSTAKPAAAATMSLTTAPAAKRIPTTLPIMADFEIRQAKPLGDLFYGRKVTSYEYVMPKQWGYEDAAPIGKFTVTEPAKANDHPPMLVYLHGSGGHTRPIVEEAAEFPGFGPEFLTLGLDCTDRREGWYGYHWAAKDLQKYANQYAPPENRYLAEIQWVARKYHVDRERIYLGGLSMGGTGSLGLGMARGDIFAAMFVTVPAGTEHVFLRMGFTERTQIPNHPTGPTLQITHPPDYLARISGAGKPDAPPVVNFSSQMDGAATNQENLLQACHDGRHLMVFTWAPWGHKCDYARINPAVLAYPWLSIRRDEAYPVFTDATSDQHYPGLYSKDDDQEGQINAYFRWKNVRDEPAQFRMDLWLVTDKSIAAILPGGSSAARREKLSKALDEMDKWIDATRAALQKGRLGDPPPELPPLPVLIPESSTVDITPRRLQKFKVDPAGRYSWRLVEGEKVIQSGVANPDEVGLLTIPRVTITASVRTLLIEPR